MTFASLRAGFDRLVEALAILALVALLTVVTLGIVTRAIGRPFSWTDEMSGYLMVWLASLGWILATRRGAHIRIRYFRDKLPRAPKRWLEVAVQAGVGLVGLVVGVQGIHLVLVNADMEAVSIPVSVGWLYGALVPAGFVSCIQAIAEIIRGGAEFGSDVPKEPLP